MNRRDMFFSLYPSILRGNGTGHLVRCRYLAQRLGPGTALVLPEAGRPGHFSQEEAEGILGGRAAGVPVRTSPPENPGIMIFDTRGTGGDLYARLASQGPVIALDEDPPLRDSAQYVVDTLPRVKKQEANAASVGYLDLPDRGSDGSGGGGVLVTFGGEDPAGLTEKLLRVLVPRFFPPDQLTVIRPGLGSAPAVPVGVRCVDPLPELKSRLSDFDLVFCSFGLTAFEACAAGTPVILLNPSRYHRALSRAAGLPDIGVGRVRTARLALLLSDRPRLSRLCNALIPEEKISLASLIRDLDFSGPRGCPVCGKNANPAAARFDRSTYFRCTDCDLVYLEDFSGRRVHYDRDYFFEEYRRQYGKTYLEDFDTIKRMSSRRAAVITRLCPHPAGGTPRLLDVGCAYGPFLAAARDAGFDPRGTDVSPEAVKYVVSTLGIPATASSFEEYEPDAGDEAFEALAMWYVIEHFGDLDRVLKKVSRLLVPGGVFAFSTPNLRGISGRRNLRAFLQASPADHRTVFSPASARKVLSRYGMSLARIRVTGHHPERFPPGPRGVYGIISRLFGLGDTFEVYAVKTGEP